MVRLLLSHGASPQWIHPSYRYPLLDAVASGDVELIELLIQHGADIHYNSGKVFCWAAYGNQKAIERLLQIEMTPAQRETYLDRILQSAAHSANLILVSWLLDQGANVNYDGGEYGSPIQAVMSNSHLFGKHRLVCKTLERIRYTDTYSINNRLLILRTLIDKGVTMPSAKSTVEFGSPLSIAIEKRQLTSAELLLDYPPLADVNAYGGKYHSPLQAAVRMLPSLVPRLLALGADIHATGDEFGTALHTAAYTHDTEMISLLISKGADPTIIVGKYGSILQAAAKENATCTNGFSSARASTLAMKLLVEYGAHVNATGGKYHTALQMAAKSGNFEGFRWLLDNGADPKIEGGKFRTIMNAAARKGKVRYDIISFLEQHMFTEQKVDLDEIQ
jgi:ankyrin repeat protein